MLGVLASSWGLLGILVLLGSAIFRLASIGLAALDHPLSWYHWAMLACWVPFMAYQEGYAGFQKSFAPRVAARVAYLRRHPTFVRTLLAPLFCMSYFHSERRRQLLSIGLTVVIIGFVVLAHQLSQPWRGIVDIGVVVGLLWGVVSLAVFSVLAFANRLRCSAEVPREHRA